MAAMPSVSDPRVVVRLSRDLHERLVVAAGPRGRAAFVRGALEAALSGTSVAPAAGLGAVTIRRSTEAAAVSTSTGSSGSASPRAPEKPSVAELVRLSGGQLSFQAAERALGEGTWGRWVNG